MRNKISDAERSLCVDNSITALIDFLSITNQKATFFVVGNTISDDSLRSLNIAGHEIGFHTADHIRVWDKTAEQFLKELILFRERVYSVTGQQVIGFRAPSFSIDKRNEWAYACLHEAGFKYDSSVFPARTPLYGDSSAEKTKYTMPNGLVEFPMTVGPAGLPICGGFYFRLFPMMLLMNSLEHVQKKRPLNIYSHNWEMFPALFPHYDNIPQMSKYYCYHNIDKTLARVQKIMTSFQFRPLGAAL